MGGEGITIRVWSGTYKQGVEVDKSLSLIGNGTNKVTIGGELDMNSGLISADHEIYPWLTEPPGEGYQEPTETQCDCAIKMIQPIAVQLVKDKKLIARSS